MSHPQESEPEEIVHEFRAGRVTEAVVDAIAEAAGSDPFSINPIYDAIDPDALDALLRNRGSEVTLGFSHDGFTVEVNGGGTIRVVPEHRR